MPETPTSPDNREPVRESSSSPDYGEWVDEGTTALLEDIGARTESPDITRDTKPVPASECPINVIHDQEQQSYGAWLGQEQVGYVSYRLAGNRVALWSTAVLPMYRKRGVATELIAKVLDDIRASGRTVTIICPIVREMISHYPQYEDLVDKAHPRIRPRMTH
jgi:predicted GNAT family acetyltransferase